MIPQRPQVAILGVFFFLGHDPKENNMKNRGHRLEDWFIQTFIEELSKPRFGCPIQKAMKASEEADKLLAYDMLVEFKGGLSVNIDVTLKHPEEKKCLKVYKSGKFGWKVKYYLDTVTKTLVVRIGSSGISPSGLIDWLTKRYNEGKLTPPI